MSNQDWRNPAQSLQTYALSEICHLPQQWLSRLCLVKCMIAWPLTSSTLKHSHLTANSTVPKLLICESRMISCSTWTGNTSPCLCFANSLQLSILLTTQYGLIVSTRISAYQGMCTLGSSPTLITDSSLHQWRDIKVPSKVLCTTEILSRPSTLRPLRKQAVQDHGTPPARCPCLCWQYAAVHLF